MFYASNVSFIRIFAGAGHFTDVTESATSAERLSSDRRSSTRLLLLVYLSLQVQLVSLVGQFSRFTRLTGTQQFPLFQISNAQSTSSQFSAFIE